MNEENSKQHKEDGGQDSTGDQGEQKEVPSSLYEYIKAHSYSQQSGVKRDAEDRVVLTQAFCQDGHLLIADDVRFDGEAGLKLLGRYKDAEFDVILSPIMHDRRKQCPKLPRFALVELCCPVCKKPLPRIAPCGCTVGSFYRQVFLTKDADPAWSIGICDAYGCPRSFIRDNGEIISEVRSDLMWQLWGKWL